MTGEYVHDIRFDINLKVYMCVKLIKIMNSIENVLGAQSNLRRRLVNGWEDEVLTIIFLSY